MGRTFEIKGGAVPGSLPRRGVVPAIVAAAIIVALVVAAVLMVEQAVPAAPVPREGETTAAGPVA